MSAALAALLSASSVVAAVYTLGRRTVRTAHASAGPPPGHRLSPRARARSIEAGWPDAIDMLLLTISAGYLPLQAMDAVAGSVTPPIGQAFHHVVQRCATGARFADALGFVAGALGPIAHPLVDGLALADRYGLPLGPVLERLADEARHYRRRAAEARARQLPVRLAAPMVVCTLPSFVLLAIAPLLIGALSSLRR